MELYIDWALYIAVLGRQGRKEEDEQDECQKPDHAETETEEV